MKRNKKRKTCLSKGQPNVNLLTFVSAKHKPTPKHLSCAMYRTSYYKRGFSFHMICSVLDELPLCYFHLNSQVFTVIREPCNATSLSFQATQLQ